MWFGQIQTTAGNNDGKKIGNKNVFLSFRVIFRKVFCL
jgi:hypothetical protein